jgi:quercetin dioxygenase-like cupin family protein
MKRFRTVIPLVGLLLAVAWDAARAQDPVKVAPGNYKVTLDNSRVRVLDIHIKPGEKVATHSHPGYIAMALTPCKVKFTDAKGKSETADFKPNEPVWRPAETHAAENVGTEECHAMNFELKGSAPAKKSK